MHNSLKPRLRLSSVWQMRVLDLFSGIGGFSLGLERAGFETVAFCEIDKKCHKVLNKHWPDVPIFEDVCTLTKELLDERGITVDVICGGFPCQDISLAGKGAGIEGERSGLWTEYARIISELRPKFVIVENVAALLSRGLDRVLGDLAEIGYDAEWHCIPASAVGAPHRRDRIWIVAYPSSGERETGIQKQGILRPLPQDGSVNDYFGGRSATHSTDVAYPASTRLERPIWSKLQGDGVRSTSGGDNVAYPSSERSQGQGQSIQSFSQAQIINRQAIVSVSGGFREFWRVEPNVGRVANGVPNKVDRLKQLGNAVVPQIPELIGRAIMAKKDPHG